MRRAWGRRRTPKAKLAGDTEDAERGFEAACDLAAARGLRYLAAEQVARLPTGEVLGRVKAATRRDGEPDPVEAAGVMGAGHEFSRERLAVRVNRKLQSRDLIDVLADQLIFRGVPSHIRSKNSSEFVATAV